MSSYCPNLLRVQDPFAFNCWVTTQWDVHHLVITKEVFAWNFLSSKGNKEKEWSYILRPLRAREREIPQNRTETPEEALHDTLLSILTSSDQDNVTEEVLHEAYCRDMEAFSDVFLEDFVPLTTTTTTSTTARPTTPTRPTIEFGRDGLSNTGKGE